MKLDRLLPAGSGFSLVPILGNMEQSDAKLIRSNQASDSLIVKQTRLHGSRYIQM